MENKGFSLIEVVTAIFILTVGVGGAFSLIYQTLSAVYLVRSELTASFLAQEGVEIVKNLRDNAWLYSRAATSTSWLAYLSEAGGDYEVDYSTKFPPKELADKDRWPTIHGGNNKSHRKRWATHEPISIGSHRFDSTPIVRFHPVLPII